MTPLLSSAALDFVQLALALLLTYLVGTFLLGPDSSVAKRKQAKPIQHHQDRAPLVADNP